MNTIIEEYKDAKDFHLCFVDISAAYDNVNRSILWERLKKLNMPNSIMNFLQNYYQDDNIVCRMGSVESKKHYLSRGLRQGR